MASFSFKISPRRKQFVKFITKIYELLEDAYWYENKQNGLTKKMIADCLGVHKSYVTRLFGGSSNITLETLSNLAFELNRDIKIDFVRRSHTVKTIPLVDKEDNIYFINGNGDTSKKAYETFILNNGVKQCQV